MARVRDKAGTRARLLDAGLRLSARNGLKATTVNSVITEAESTKGAFFHHFPDRPAYLVALHRLFHDRLFDDVAAATAEFKPGLRWLLVAAETYLDGCLQDYGTRGLLLEARGEPGIRDEIDARNRQAAELVTASLEVLRVPEPTAVAPLLIAAVVEAASLEHSAGHPIGAVRRALAALIPHERWLPTRASTA